MPAHYQVTGTSSFNCYGADPACYSAPPCTTTISSGLTTAINNAASGTVICLNNGSYGAITLTGVNKSSDVIIQPAPGQTATLGLLTVQNSSHLKFQGLTIAGMLLGESTAPGTSGSPIGTYITLSHNAFTDSATVENRASAQVVHLLIDGNTFNDLGEARWEGRLSVDCSWENCNANPDIVISNNQFANILPTSTANGNCSDGIQVTQSAYGIQIGPGNEFKGIAESNCTSHNDPIQFYADNGHSTITGNYFHDNGDGSGGIAGFDGINTLTITNNVFRCTGQSATDEIATWGSINSLIEHNYIGSSCDMSFRQQNNGTVSSGNTLRNNVFDSTAGLNAPGGFGTATYNLNSGLSGTGNITGLPILVGGSNPTTYAGFALTTGSIGHNAASDGTDMGINVSNSGPVANVWVTTTGNDSTCVRGDQTKPCLTFAKACQKAIAGDIVGVNPGTYPAQAVSNTDCPNASSSAQIVFRGISSLTSPAKGATADAPFIGGSCSVGCTSLFFESGGGGFNGGSGPGSGNNGPNYITLENLHFQGAMELTGNQGETGGSSTGIGIVLNHITSGAEETSGLTNVLIKNSDFGNCAIDFNMPCMDQSRDWALQTPNGRSSTSGMITDSVYHDYLANDSASHVECYFALDWRVFTIQNSQFYNCDVSGPIRIERITNPAASSLLTIQNNWFGWSESDNVSHTQRCEGITWGSNSGSLSNVLIRYNSFTAGEGPAGSSGSPTPSFRIIGNLIGLEPGVDNGCEVTPPTLNYGSAVVSGNIWWGADLGTNSAHVVNLSAFNALYVNSDPHGAADYHLASGTSVPNGHVPNSGSDYSLTTDKDGNTRSFPTEAGADEFGGSGTPDTTPPTVSMTAPSNGATVSGCCVTVSANAADDVAVAGVQFRLDGANQGSEDTSRRTLLSGTLLLLLTAAIP